MAKERTFLQRIFNISPQEEIKQGGNMMGYFGVGSEERKSYKYADLANEGYLKNAIVYRCVNEISKGASAVPFVLRYKDTIVEDHPLIDLLNRPNPLQSYTEFFNSLYGYLLLSGNSYVLKVGAERGAPQELHQLRPDRITIKGGGNPIPEKYQYMINGKVQAVYPVDQDSGFSELKHIKLWNPLDDYYGCSPLAAAAVEVDQHNMSSKHNVNLLSNGARPSGAVIFKPKDDQGFPVNLTESQRQQLLTDLNNRFSGTSNAGRPLLLEGDFDWKEMGLSPKDMDFLNLKHLSSTDIAMCFGVPSQLVGVPDAQTYANVAEARLALYEETIIPYLRKIASDLNEWLVPMFGDSLSLDFDIDAIPALSERRKKIYENVIGAVREGIMTRNEAREKIGLDPVKGADGLYISATLFPLGEEDVPQPKVPADNDEDIDEMDDLDDDEKMYGKSCGHDHSLEEKQTNFPNRGDDKAISLRNSEHEQFDYNFAKNVKEVGVGKQIWKAGGNIRGNEAFTLWGKAKAGEKTEGVLKWIKEREAWGARHFRDGQKFKDGSVSPNLSNVAGVVAQMKWGVVGNLGMQGMKDVILELTKKLEGRQDDPDDKFVDENWQLYISDDDCEIKGELETKVSGAVKKTLENKVKDHNDKVGDKPNRRATLRMLTAVFNRGVGAYRNNPSSVRPRVTGPEQWAFARVNSYLFALRTGRWQGGKHDQDLFPKGHPLSSK